MCSSDLGDVGKLLSAVMLKVTPQAVTVSRGRGVSFDISGQGLAFVNAWLNPKAPAWLLFPLSREGPMSRVLSVVVLVMADEVTLHSVVRAVWDWWSTYRRWGVTSNRSLYIAASLLALGLFLTSHYLVRTCYPAAPLNLQGAGLR